ncbi:MAG: ComEC/Rec2 family competence protein [Candidatus Aureabacteria bacterium]|nr:ComEC/Rec2 family competence protein [Candidatus Auribacterota bacterium]
MATPPAQKSLSVYFFDVGHGDATIIRTPGGKNILVDAGGGGKKRDMGRDVILPFMRAHGIRRLDAVVMSHADSDHIGGMRSILASSVQVGEFLDPGYPHTAQLYDDILTMVKRRPQTKYRQPCAGDILDWGPELKVRVMGPVKPVDMGTNPNDSSLVIMLTYGAVSVLLTGDAGKSEERDMIDRFGPSLRARILKVGHHGSRNSSSEAFLKAVAPEVAVISASGREGQPKYRFALDRLKAAGATVYATDYNGTLTLTSDGRGFRITGATRSAPVWKGKALPQGGGVTHEPVRTQGALR